MSQKNRDVKGWLLNRLALSVGLSVTFVLAPPAVKDLSRGLSERHANTQNYQATTDIRHGTEEALLTALGLGCLVFGIKKYKSVLEY